MNWKEFLKSSPRTLPELLKSYGLNEINDPSISQHVPGALVNAVNHIAFKADLAHMGLGVSSELIELEEAIEKGDSINIEEELVDILWYVSGTIHVLKNKTRFKLENVENIDISNIKGFTTFTRLTCSVSNFTDISKKSLAYKRGLIIGNKPVNASKEFYYESEIDTLLCNIVEDVVRMMNVYRCDFERGLQNNQDKLKARYPEKFTEDNANTRNLDKEYKELSKGH